jgi:hypothetical protein
MNYTFKDFIRCINHWLSKTDVKNIWASITFTAFLTQYDIYKWPILKKAVKYIHNGEPISKTSFYIGDTLIVESEDIAEIDDKEAVGEYSLPPQVEERIKTVIDRYRNYKNWQISLEIRRMLNLSVEKWHDYRGMDIDEYLYSEKYKLRHQEI